MTLHDLIKYLIFGGCIFGAIILCVRPFLPTFPDACNQDQECDKPTDLANLNPTRKHDEILGKLETRIRKERGV